MLQRSLWKPGILSCSVFTSVGDPLDSNQLRTDMIQIEYCDIVYELFWVGIKNSLNLPYVDKTEILVKRSC